MFTNLFIQSKINILLLYLHLCGVPTNVFVSSARSDFLNLGMFFSLTKFFSKVQFSKKREKVGGRRKEKSCPRKNFYCLV